MTNKDQNMTVEEQVAKLREMFEAQGGTGYRLLTDAVVERCEVLAEGVEPVDENYTYEGIASATQMDRSNVMGIDVAGLDISEYLRDHNRAILLYHRQGPDNPPIGRADDVYKEGTNNQILRCVFTLNPKIQKAIDTKVSIDERNLNGLSIGFVPDFTSARRLNDGAIMFERAVLTEISVVAVGVDPEAYIEVRRSINEDNSLKLAEAFKEWEAKVERQQETEVEETKVEGNEGEAPEEQVEETEGEDQVSLTDQIADLQVQINDMKDEATARQNEVDDRIVKEATFRAQEDSKLMKEVRGLSERMQTNPTAQTGVEEDPEFVNTVKEILNNLNIAKE